MPPKRIIPYLESGDFEAIKEFYVGVLGLEVGMNVNEGGSTFLGLESPENRSAQIVVAEEGVDPPMPRMGIDLGDPAAVDAAHAEAQRRGLEVVYGPVEEPWGIRRFFVRDPSGAVVSVLAHV